MWRKLLALVLLILLTVLITTPVYSSSLPPRLITSTRSYAPSTIVVITVTASLNMPGWPFGVLGFTVTRITDTSIKLDWTPHATTDNVTIRVKYGEPPANRSDGYPVYYGDGSATTMTWDNSTSLNNVFGTTYYRIWSENSSGGWSTEYREGYTEGIAMFLIVVALIAVALTWLAYKERRITIGIGAAFGWLITSVYSYSQSTAIWDIYFCLFWFAIAMMLAIGIEAAMMRASAPGTVSDLPENTNKTPSNEHSEYLHPVDKIRMKHGLPPSAARERRDKNRRSGW